MDTRALDIALSALESLEMRSLQWGFIDQSLSEAEVYQAIADSLMGTSGNDDPGDVLDALCATLLVRMLLENGQRRYRTRFGEIVRLSARLRQWFDGQSWQAAPTLVSDFRVDVRSRLYPRRDIPTSAAKTRVKECCEWTELRSAVWEALTGGSGGVPLAQFQVDAAERLLSAPRGSGTIVTAGTGSGKTLAFYLPALVGMASEVRREEWWTKAICIYPRQELLKDQLSEAYALARRASTALIGYGRRPFVFASLFGPTPFEASRDAVEKAGWTVSADGFSCPFVRCPDCSSSMVWPHEALAQGQEMLRCESASCGVKLDSTTIRLTRRSLQERPADLLFTTTEMLNGRMSDTRMRHVFGVREPQGRAPLYALLDEVHTYSGVSGAQVALLLRRWSALLNAKLRWAGLSATLPQPTRFFADLTGVRVDEIAAIAPSPADMVSEGAEYSLVLRSDASSQVATLSTSIQAIMLIARMLDPPSSAPSEGRFGSRAFVFTDDLDVTNRLYDNLLDAEAYNRWRRVNAQRRPLAALRQTPGPERTDRERAGQVWQMAEELQTSLTQRLVVGRTSSRDPGVATDANVIVATSTLEVGFNDPTVGAVFQHKAPRSAASFLQRRGRAGRHRRMRPLTVVVLSDYGRDRIAFQSYEDLFNPIVEIQSLPIRNLYVLRMQAVHATFDWVASLAPPGAAGWSWSVFAGPKVSASQQAFLDHAKEMLRRLVRLDKGTLDGLRAHLRAALQVDASTLDSVLWDQPRSLLLEALPTLARRVFRDWVLADGAGLDFHSQSPPHPLPDFVPANLFSDLNLPEVFIPVPGTSTSEVAAMPIVQALQQFVPGRVRRRFADWQAKVSHWIPLDLSLATQDILIGSYSPRHEYVGCCDGINIYRPWELQITTAPGAVGESSNARWTWQSHFEQHGDSKRVALPSVAGLKVIQDLSLCMHRFGAALSVSRFAHDGEASVRVNRREQRMRFRIVDQNGERAAVGFQFEADALIAPFSLPSASELAKVDLSPELSRWLRYLALTHHVEHHSILQPRLNAFLREWLQQIVLLTAVSIAEREAITLQEACKRLEGSPRPEAYAPAIDALIAANRTPWPDDDDEDEDGQDSKGPLLPATAQSRLAAAVTLALSDQAVTSALTGAICEWVHPDTVGWGKWLGHVAESTIAEAVYQACVAAAPQNAATEGLTVDLDRGSGQLQVIVAETTLGGGGIIEALAETFAADPRAFVRGLESACSPSDREMAAGALRRVMRLLEAEPELRDSLARLRAADDTATREKCRAEFFALLGVHGVSVSRTLSVLLATRLVTPGATAQTDRLTLLLLNAWEALEEKYGIAFPCRLAASVIGLTVRIPELTEFAGAGREIVAAGLLLWPWGGELRHRALQSYSPYRSPALVDAEFAAVLLFDSRLSIVDLDAPDWQEQAARALAVHGTARLVTRESGADWRTRIVAMLDAPVESGFLQFFPMIEATRQLADGRLAIDLLLRDRV